MHHVSPFFHWADPCVQKGLARSVAADGEASLLLLSSCIECDRSVKEVEYRLIVCGAGNEKIRSEAFSETVSFEGDRRDGSGETSAARTSMPTEAQAVVIEHGTVRKKRGNRGRGACAFTRLLRRMQGPRFPRFFRTV